MNGTPEGDPPPDMTVNEVAHLLRTTVPTVWGLIKSGRLPSYTLSGGPKAARRIRRDAVEVLRAGGDPRSVLQNAGQEA